MLGRFNAFNAMVALDVLKGHFVFIGFMRRAISINEGVHFADEVRVIYIVLYL